MSNLQIRRLANSMLVFYLFASSSLRRSSSSFSLTSFVLLLLFAGSLSSSKITFPSSMLSGLSITLSWVFTNGWVQRCWSGKRRSLHSRRRRDWPGPEPHHRQQLSSDWPGPAGPLCDWLIMALSCCHSPLHITLQSPRQSMVTPFTRSRYPLIREY